MAKKNRKQQSTPEEIAMMKRADEMASGISNKPETTEVFKEEVVEDAKPKGVTVIDAGLQNRRQSDIESAQRLRELAIEKERKLDEIGNSKSLNNNSAKANARAKNFDAAFGDWSSSITTANDAEQAAKNSPTGVTTYTPEQVTAGLLQTLGTAPQSGKAIIDAVDKDPNASFNDKVAANDVAEVANKEEQKQGVATASALSAAISNMSDEDKAEYQNFYNKRFNTPDEEVVTTVTTPNASSNALSTIGQGVGVQTVDAIGTKDDIEKETIRQAKEEYKEIPTGVIEKLGVQDYYPEIGRDIAVGTFTGSRIGSQTIYSGAGGLLPMGLYDARKRALAETAKQKQAALDKIMKTPDVVPQFNTEYKSYAYNGIQDELEKNGNDYNRLIKNRESMNKINRLKTLAEEINYVDASMNEIMKRYNDAKKDGGDVFIEEDILKEIDKFKRGMVDDLPGVLSGKVKITEKMKGLRDYADGMTQVDKMIKDYAFNKVEIPFNIKTKKEINAENIGELQDALVKIKSGQDVDKYMSVIKQYYDMDVTAMDNWLDEKGYAKDSPARQQIKDYYTKRIPAESFITKIETDPNQNFERQKEANRKRESERDYNLKREQGKTHWTITNEQMNFVDKSSGKPMNQLIGEWRGQGINGKALTNKIQSAMAQNGLPTKFDDYLRSPVMIQQPSADEMKTPQQFSAPSTKVKVQVYRKDKKGKMGWFATEMKLEDLANLPSSKTKNYRLSEGAGYTPFEPETQKVYKELLTDKNARFFGTENYVAYGSVNTNTKNIERLSGDTYNTYDGNKPVNIKISNGNIVREVTYDDMGNPIPGTRVPGEFFFENEISTQGGRNPQDNIHGTGIQKFGGGGTTYSGSSSYSSGGE
jgi:hypothetical protein